MLRLLPLGLAYKTTMTIQVADKEQGVVLGTTKTKKQNKLKLYFWFRNCDEKTNTMVFKKSSKLVAVHIPCQQTNCSRNYKCGNICLAPPAMNRRSRKEG
ncbi:hypothetical protein Bca52824_022894 [Brassica carinata]|uniref:Uncharacterized protein n=1 Tax=Brassica carinata TaxID=52824 RepID=A0A8X8AV10_BRACI|nr:hypothetical protein Bca52824_022894 [Brassica carinata]